MARGEAEKKELIGHAVYGELKGRRWLVHSLNKNKAGAIKFVQDKYHLDNPRAYPIYKD